MLRARWAHVRNGGDREPSPGLCSEPFERAPRPTRCVGGPRYNIAVAESPRDEFPNNFVGDLVHTERGWVVVPPTCCPDGHDYSDGGWSVSAVRCSCNARHMEWRCIAAQPFTHRSRGLIAASATEARCRCGRTGSAVDLARPGRCWAPLPDPPGHR
jgi:hypothetical protein